VGNPVSGVDSFLEGLREAASVEVARGKVGRTAGVCEGTASVGGYSYSVMVIGLVGEG